MTSLAYTYETLSGSDDAVKKRFWRKRAFCCRSVQNILKTVARKR
jgi:hypothetical protein